MESGEIQIQRLGRVRGPVRRIMDDAGVSFQTAELGKVDVGGGGTIAYIPAKYGMDVIDSGMPVLSVHSPWEVTSKADIYEARRGYEAFCATRRKLSAPPPRAFPHLQNEGPQLPRCGPSASDVRKL